MFRILACLALLLPTACGWFGNREDIATVAPEAVDPSILIERVTRVRAERAPGGIILSVEGVAARLGAYDAQLVPLNEGLPDGQGALGFEFRVMPSSNAAIGASDWSRTVLVGTFLRDGDLRGARSVRVVGGTGAATAPLR